MGEVVMGRSQSRASHLGNRTGSVLLVVVLVAGLLAAVPRVSYGQDGDAFDIRLAPANPDNTAVRPPQQVRVSGTAPSGTISSATLIAVYDDGSRAEQPISTAVLNRQPTSSADYLHNGGGTIDGELTLGCRFGEPIPQAAHCAQRPVREALLRISIGSASGTSNAVRVDNDRPFIRGYELVEPNRVLAVFSEPVRHPGGDQAADWRVEGATVLRVEGPQENDCVGRYQPGEDATAGVTGCTRTLVLLGSLDEDATPFAEYELSTSGVRQSHIDGAANVLDRSRPGTRSNALDRIRPPLPRIDRIDGKQPGAGDHGPTVASGTRNPTVQVSNLRSGHRVHLSVTRPDGSTFETEPVAASGASAQLQLPALTEEDLVEKEYEVAAVVQDPAGNRSTDSHLSAARSDQAPSVVRYRLDTIVPRVSSVVRSGAREVLVTFTETVLPSGNAGQWQIDGRSVTATGEGRERRLDAGANLADGAVVSWAPTSSSGYADRAGNAAGAFSRELLPLPPLPIPHVEVPSGETYTAESAATVSGTALAGVRVDVVEEANPGTVRASATADADGAWSAQVNLPNDRRERLAAVAIDADTGQRSPLAGVPDIVRDTRAPQVDVTRPDRRNLLTEIDLNDPLNTDDRRRFGVGDNVTIQWSASDPAQGDEDVPDHGDRLDIDLRLGAAEPTVIKPDYPYAPGTSSHSYVLTEALLGGANTREARFGVALTDLAGNTGSDVSEPILITNQLLGYVATYTRPQSGTTPAIIELQFPQPLQHGLGANLTITTEFTVTDELGGPLQLAAGRLSADGRTVTLEVIGVTDPNATPTVQYTPTAVPLLRLQGPDGLPISQAPREAVDAVVPVLEIDAPDEGPGIFRSVTVTGATDETARPNAVRVLRGSTVVATTRASEDGDFSATVPVEPNRRNEFTVEAVDPAGNVSEGRTFSVIESSVPPVVTITAPPADSEISRNVAVRWTTHTAEPTRATIDMRVNGGGWQTIAESIPDTGVYDWRVPDQIVTEDVIDLRVTASTDRLSGSDVRQGLYLILPDEGVPGGPGGTLPPGSWTPAGPPLGGPGADDFARVIARSERTIEITFSRSVLVDDAPAGFSIFAGPGVQRITGAGATWTLHLNAELSTTTPVVTYTGAGVRFLDGRSLPHARVRAERGFAFAPEGFGGARHDEVNLLSWTDERNTPGDVVRYELRRDGALIGTTAAAVRSFSDPDAGDGPVTYTVITVDDLDHTSRPASFTLDPAAPNITPAGGFVLSPDGVAAVLVPPAAVRKDYFGALLPVSHDLVGHAAVTGGYELVVEAADDRTERLAAFERFSCTSFRPGHATLDERARERVTGLRLDAAGQDELPTRTGFASADSCFLTPGTFVLGEAPGVTTRVSGTDPALIRNRFSTAAALSQAAFAQAGAAVVARADDYPDALAASALAAQIGGPVLLSTTESMPDATVLELHRLGVEHVVLVGGEAALGSSVATQAVGMGLTVERVAGPTRFETAVAIAERTGSYGGTAFLATGQNFADALAASGPSGFLMRPILLTATDALPASTREGLQSMGLRELTVLGGSAAVSAPVEDELRASGLSTARAAGAERYSTSVALADAMLAEGMSYRRPIAASGQGDGTTSPDALAAGPVSTRVAGPLLLVPRDSSVASVDAALRRVGTVRGMVVAGGTAAVSDQTRSSLDAAAR
jgi:hypothetical protein